MGAVRCSVVTAEEQRSQRLPHGRETSSDSPARAPAPRVGLAELCYRFAQSHDLGTPAHGTTGGDQRMRSGGAAGL